MKLAFMLLSTCAAGLVSLPSRAAPLGTAFTYQGRLDQNDLPVTGSYQMVFWLYAGSSGGSPLASNTVSAVGVTNGLFTTDVDFGPNRFTGEERWLAITVATNGSSAFTLLQPRTRLAPTPNAIYASTAGTVTNGAIQVSQMATTNAPGPGQVLGYDGSSLVWQPPGGGSSVWTLAGTSAYYNGGKVGIGTASPAGKLHVANGGLAVSGTSSPYVGAGPSIFLETGFGGGLLFAYDYTPGAPNPNLPLLLNPTTTGNVGIGTVNPQSKLEVHSQDALSIVGFEPFITFHDSNHGYNQCRIQNVDGSVNLLTHSFIHQGNSSAFLKLHNNGNVGIGTGDPQSKLAVIGAASQTAVLGYTSDSIGVFGRSTTFEGVHGESSSTISAGVAGINLNTGIGVYGRSFGGGYAGAFDGKVRVCVLEITGGCDLAEPFPMKEEQIDKGSVVVIDDEHPGRLKLSTRAYDTQVAGIVSGANGISPGISLTQEGALDSGQNVALTGRVYVKADASHGAIKPGDLLTTSDTPGHAMKVSDHPRGQGAILGKAMSALQEGTGLVLVLVTLQ